jgi:hypothetical protein
MPEIATWLHHSFLALSISGGLGTTIVMMVRLRQQWSDPLDHFGWLRGLIALGALILSGVWTMQLTQLIDVGPYSQSFALSGTALLLTCHVAREWLSR